MYLRLALPSIPPVRTDCTENVKSALRDEDQLWATYVIWLRVTASVSSFSGFDVATATCGFPQSFRSKTRRHAGRGRRQGQLCR